MTPTPKATTRRTFLSKSGLATAAPSMPHIASAQDAAGPKLRIGIVGCGGSSNVVGEMAIRDGRFEVVSLADYFQNAVDTQGAKSQVLANAASPAWTATGK